MAVVYDAFVGTKPVYVDGRHATAEVSWNAGPDHGGVVRIGMSDWSEAGAMMLRGGESRPLEPGMIFHILPAIFEYRKYGVGMSETVLITENGHEVLTNVERKLFVL